jgi:hypothetical protein
MRRALVTALLSAALLGAAACSDGGGTPAPGASGAGSAGSPSAGDGEKPGDGEQPGGAFAGTATGNATQVCAAARKLSTEKVTAFITELGVMLSASGSGDTAAAQKAERAAGQAIRDWSTGLRAQAREADDPRLARVLGEMATEAATVTTDIESIDDARLDDLQGRLDTLCGS